MTECFRYTFKLESIKLDNREYRQDSDMFLPHTSLYVSVDLPREKDYVLNLEAIIQAELSSGGGGVPDPVLTPKGFAYVKKALEAGFETPKLVVTEDAWVETEKKLSPEKVKDTWTDPDWGAGKLKPETEPWNEAEAGSWE